MKRFLAALFLVLAACSGGGDERVIVAAGTTLVDSGLLDAAARIFETEHPDIDLSVVGEATAQVLELGRRGAADVMIVHAPELEAEFVEDGLAARYELVLSSTFVLVGPPGEAPFGAASDVLGALAASGSPFVSRADGSGTYEVERLLWAAAGIEPDGQPWYLETGQGMGLTLQVADQRKAYTLSELGTFLAASGSLSLEPVEVSDLPQNPYHLIVVATSPVRAAGELFLDWLLGPDGREAIRRVNLELFDRVVYEPAG